MKATKFRLQGFLAFDEPYELERKDGKNLSFMAKTPPANPRSTLPWPRGNTLQ